MTYQVRYFRFMLGYFAIVGAFVGAEIMSLRLFAIDIETSISAFLPAIILSFLQGRAIVKANGQTPDVMCVWKFAVPLALIFTFLNVLGGIVLLIWFSPDWAAHPIPLIGIMVVVSFFVNYVLTGFFLWFGTRAVKIRAPRSGHEDSALAKKYQFSVLRFSATLLLLRLFVLCAFAVIYTFVAKMNMIAVIFLTYLGGAICAAMYEGDRKGNLDKAPPQSSEWRQIKRGMMGATIGLDILSLVAMIASLALEGEEIYFGGLLAPKVIGTMTLLYIAVAVLMPLFFYNRARTAAKPAALR